MKITAQQYEAENHIDIWNCSRCDRPNVIELDPQEREYNYCPTCKLGQYSVDLPIFSVCICETDPCTCC